MNRKMQVAALLGATMLSTTVWAQETDEIIVLSSPSQKAATEVISTTEILTAEDIQNNIDGPLGNLLDGLPGVDSAGFGPAVGQPLIRGLGGYRVDTMTNGMSIGDIAATAGDHANALSLFDTDRIEVLKGPAALRYGAFAATGVINSFNRHMDGAADDTTDVLLGMGDNADETLMGFFARRGDFAISAFSQDADNITIPTHAESEAFHEQEEAESDDGDDHEELVDSEQEADDTENESTGFTVSARFGDDETNLSLMLVNHEMEYGVPGHSHGGGEEIVIDAEQQTAQARLIHNLSGNRFDMLQADLTIGAFEQTEGETEFEQDSMHLRTELSGERNGWQTLVGFEFRDNELTATTHEDEDEDEGAVDDEHGHGFYLPNTKRSQYGLFVFAERERNDWLSEVALRFDSVDQESNHVDEPDENADVSHDLTNFSVGLARKLEGNMLLGGSLSSTERAPSQVELFAEGDHVAVGRNEEGDPQLDKETSLSTELYLRRNWGMSSLRFALFNNDYSDFIYMKRNSVRDEADDGILGFDYDQQDAELSGYEVEYLTGFAIGGRTLDVKLSYSAITGELADGGNLPAMPPEKIGLGFGMDFNAFRLNVDVEDAADQTDTGVEELATDGYTSIDVSAGWSPARYEGLHITAGIRNVTDEEIRHHTSPLKDLLPEPGQDIRLIARYRF
ncbi:MAG: TonB-dependent receptor [Alphaproteobacteria bacterium]|nr:TonB-dependent receptor [Alphaproteobacteria bacterium]